MQTTHKAAVQCPVNVMEIMLFKAFCVPRFQQKGVAKVPLLQYHWQTINFHCRGSLQETRQHGVNPVQYVHFTG